MGEIGIQRREFLYDLRFWEVRRIVKGYRRRNRLTHQLLAECAYASLYSMRDPKGKTAVSIFPSIFDDDDEVDRGPGITKEEYDELQALMAKRAGKEER